MRKKILEKEYDMKVMCNLAKKTLISKLNITFEKAIAILEVCEYLVDRCKE